MLWLILSSLTVYEYVEGMPKLEFSKRMDTVEIEALTEEIHRDMMIKVSHFITLQLCH